MLEQELAAAKAADAPNDELGALNRDIHGLRVDLGIEIELTDEDRRRLSDELIHSPTHERAKEIAAIARRAGPPSGQL